MMEIVQQVPGQECEQGLNEANRAGRVAAPIWRSWSMLIAGAALAAVIGTWLVWFSLVVQRKFNEEDIRAACHRVMPETADRCYDTVVIQRGGVRR